MKQIVKDAMLVNKKSHQGRAAFDVFVKKNLRLLSAYKTSKRIKIWVITEADRSSTTILLPNEY
jgi:hypothetical protein